MKCAGFIAKYNAYIGWTRECVKLRECLHFMFLRRTKCFDSMVVNHVSRGQKACFSLFSSIRRKKRKDK